jgi:predicted alpha-1,2-mannosidase
VEVPDPLLDAPSAARVDVFVGTANRGNTLPGPTLPWGMVSPSPHNHVNTVADALIPGANAASGYFFGEPTIHGFGQTHLSGVGCPDLGAPVLMATTSGFATTPASAARGYSNERAWPGYYGVTLDGGIEVELTATERVGVHRITFPEGATGTVQIDALTSLSMRTTVGEVGVVSDTELEGTVTTGGFCAEANEQDIHFVARFDRPADDSGTWDGGAWLDFETSSDADVVVAIGVSYISIAGARANLDAEWGGDFDDAHRDAVMTWERQLERVTFEGGTADQQAIATTALYHLLIHPGTFADADGSTLSYGDRAPIIDPDRHHVFSLWDTYRNVHSWLALVHPDRQRAMLGSLSRMTHEVGTPPRWEIAGYEADVMVGDPMLVVLADSLAKGVADEIALEALFDILYSAASATDGHRKGNAEYMTLGYVPQDLAGSVWGPVSTTLEYAVADWALATVADHLGKTTERDILLARSTGWRALYDAETGLLRPRFADGTWLEPFDPDALEGSKFWNESGGPGYVEGTAWTYAFFAPHDTAGLVALHGSEAALTDAIEHVFATDRFAMWNEPDINYPWLFTQLDGQAWRSQQHVRAALDASFGLGPDGLPGNDDTGTMSAWALFASLGFYPDPPGSDRYALTVPVFDAVTLAVEGGTFHIETTGTGDYVESTRLNGAVLDRPWLTHAEIASGGTLEIERRQTPRTD